MTGIQNDDDDVCSRKTLMNCDIGGGGGAGPWSDLTHDVLFLVMMQLGVIDFVAFSGVCKSWRSLAISYMNTFMESRPPMFMTIGEGETDEDEQCCYLMDVDGRRFKTVLPHSANKGICVGVTCGYVILMERRTRDFWLVNLITRHELHFPDAPLEVIHNVYQGRHSAILVFSPSISGWVLVLLDVDSPNIWFSRGEGAWNEVSSTVPMKHLHFFKGKIYTQHAFPRHTTKKLGVMKLNSKEAKISLLETKSFPSFARGDFVCSAENLYVLQRPSYVLERPNFIAYKLDFGEMKWVVLDEDTSQGYAFFLCLKNQGVVVKPASWWQSQFQFSRFADLCGNERFFEPDYMWYFPHECRSINRMDE